MTALHSIWGRILTKLWMLNSANITLIPKKIEADQGKDFRSISLIHSFAKLVANHLDQMVSPNQSAFSKKCYVGSANRKILELPEATLNPTQIGHYKGI